MSGAAEGIAGLALSAVSVAALFTTCIQCFDIVIAGKNFGEDWEQLFCMFSLQRTRFGLWGESVGLVPNPNDGRRLPYNANIDREDIRPGVESILNNIRLLLQEADGVDERYGLKIVAGGSSDISMSVGMNIFKDSFERFKSRIKKNQKQKSAWQVTRWAIHDATKFEKLISRLEKYVDGLEKLTDSLDRLEQRLREEIDSISDVQSLRLLRDASSSHRSSTRHNIPDTASRRMIRISETGLETRTLATASMTYDTGVSFVTAESKPSSWSFSLPISDPPLPGAWPRSITSEPSRRARRTLPSTHHAVATSKSSISCAECLEEHYECVPHDTTFSCSRCYIKKKSCSFDRELIKEGSSAVQEDAKVIGETLQPTDGPQDLVIPPEAVPQNQRLLSELVQQVNTHRPLSFERGDSHYGESLEEIKAADINFLLKNSANFLNQANNGSSAAKRMFFELRNIRTGNVPFVSAAPIGDSLDKVLASIEGPPETPYEGGVFWITVKLSDKNVMGPPLMRFHTKIYHPNISPQGHICADYKEKWSSVFSTGSRSTVTSPDAAWYHGKSHDIHWSLGALLTALCGLLASPDVEDPLVPEIAHKYLTDYDGYCEAAKVYTKRYAIREKPCENDLMFLDDEMDSEKDAITVPSLLTVRELEADTVSVQRSLRETYDEPFPKDAITVSSDSGDSERYLLNSTELKDRSRKKAMRLFENSIDHALRYHRQISDARAQEYTIETAWNEVARRWDYKTWWVPTHIDIGFRLLKEIDLLVRHSPDKHKDFYMKHQKNINLSFAKRAIDAKSVSVFQWPHDLGTMEYLIEVEDQSGQTWVGQASIERFIIFQIAIKETYSIAFETDLASLEELTAHPIPKTLERFLQQVLDLPKADLLAMSQFVDLMKPIIGEHNSFILAEYTPDRPREFSSFKFRSLDYRLPDNIL